MRAEARFSAGRTACAPESCGAMGSGGRQSQHGRPKRCLIQVKWPRHRNKTDFFRGGKAPALFAQCVPCGSTLELGSDLRLPEHV